MNKRLTRIQSTIRDKIIPHAVSWFTGEAAENDEYEIEDEEDNDDDDDDDEDDEVEDDDDDDEDEDEEDANTKKKAMRMAQTSQNKHPSQQRGVHGCAWDLM